MVFPADKKLTYLKQVKDSKSFKIDFMVRAFVVEDCIIRMHEPRVLRNACKEIVKFWNNGGEKGLIALWYLINIKGKKPYSYVKE